MESLRPQTVEYPDSDGKPMSDNTLQYEWIVTIKGNLDAILPDFVGGDLLWYPVEGHPEIRMAPDVLVAIGRPKGYRGSYRTWEEAGVAPQVVFEIWSPGNSTAEAVEKHRFYEEYGVEEFYLYDPDRHHLVGWVRGGDRLLPIANMNGWTSPRLGIRFTFQSRQLVLYRPDGTHFRTFSEMDREVTETRQRVEAEKQRAEAEKQRAEAAEAREQALAARLRALGIDP